MRGIAGASALALSASLTGCFWTVPGQDADRQAANLFEDRLTVENVASLSESWEVQLDEGPAGDPVTSLSGVHVNDTRSVYAFDSDSGAEQWQYSVAAPEHMGQPFVRQDQLLVGHVDDESSDPANVDPRTLTLDAASGALIGEQQGFIRALRGSRALLVDAAVISFPFPPFSAPTLEMTVRDLATPATVYFNRFDFAPADQTSGEAVRLQDVTLGSDWIFLPSRNPAVGVDPGYRGYSISHPDPGQPTTCNQGNFTYCPNWTNTPFVGTGILTDDRSVVYKLGSGPESANPLVAITASTGATRWLSSSIPTTGLPPALSNGLLYIPTWTGDLFVYDADGCGDLICQPLWKGSIGSLTEMTTQPAVAGGVVYVGAADGSVYAFDAAGCASPPCAPLWSASTGSRITGAPAVSDGQLYVGTEDGRLLAYNLPQAPG